MKINIDVLKYWTKNTIDIDMVLDKLTLIGFETYKENNNLNVNIPYNRQNSSNLFSILYELNKLYSFNDKQLFLKKNLYINDFVIKIYDKTFCPIYNTIIINNIDNNAFVPTFITCMLQDNGISLTNSIIDILNYVTLIFGQPLHAYDLKKISKRIDITKTTKAEQVFLLNEFRINIDKDIFVTRDSNRIIAIPGIMGSFDSKIDKKTTDIFLESAFFKPKYISELSKKLNLKTCASDLFKTFINPNLTKKSLIYAANLFVDFYNASCSNISEKYYKNYLLKDKKIRLYKKSISDIIGCSLSINVISTLLSKLKFKFEDFKTYWRIIIPAYRSDIILEENIIAEIVKLYGFNKIKEKQITTITHINSVDQKNFLLKKITTMLIEKGFFEVINYSFLDSSIEKLLHKKDNFVYLKNPLSKNLDILRSNLIHGLLKTVSINLNKNKYEINIFEKGNIFYYENENLITLDSLACICTENVIFTNHKNYDHFTFFFLKGLIEEIFYIINLQDKLSFKKEHVEYLNTDVSTSIFINNKKVGCLGLINETSLKLFSIKKDFYFFSLNLTDQKISDSKIFKQFSKYPFIKRDLSIVCEYNITYKSIIEYINELKIEHLVNIELLNVFLFKQNKTKSITLRFLFQSFYETLLDNTINNVLEKIQVFLIKKFNVVIRQSDQNL